MRIVKVIYVLNILNSACVVGYRIIGCYRDEVTRDLNGYGNPGGSLDICVNNCYTRRYKYAGAQEEQCFCDNSDIGSYGVSGNCNTPCPQNADQICGGYLANTIMETGYIFCDVEFCALCLRDNVCSECRNRYNLLNSECVACHITACTLCSSENVCAYCEADHILFNNICYPDVASYYKASEARVEPINPEHVHQFQNLSLMKCIMKCRLTPGPECTSVYHKNDFIENDESACLFQSSGTGVISHVQYRDEWKYYKLY